MTSSKCWHNFSIEKTFLQLNHKVPPVDSTLYVLKKNLLHSLEGTEALQEMCDKMDIEEAPKEATEEPAVPPEPELPSEFEKLFKGCEENPEDFNGWVYLLQYVEQEVSTSEVFYCYNQ